MLYVVDAMVDTIYGQYNGYYIWLMHWLIPYMVDAMVRREKCNPCRSTGLAASRGMRFTFPKGGALAYPGLPFFYDWKK